MSLEEAQVPAIPASHARMPRPRRTHHWANAPVRWLLRSPLRGLLDDQLMLVTVRGRFSGREHTFPVGYCAGVDGWYVLVGEHQRKLWWRNLEGGADVSLVIRGETIPARARVIRWRTNHSMFEGVLGLYLRRFPRTALRLAVPMAGGVPEVHALRDAARDAVMVKVTRRP